MRGIKGKAGRYRTLLCTNNENKHEKRIKRTVERAVANKRTRGRAKWTGLVLPLKGAQFLKVYFTYGAVIFNDVILNCGI